MENHDILSPALQKYYSALKSLTDFGKGGSFFDDVSSLDTFFSEFRNITFVIQKGLGSDGNKRRYAALRDEMLSSETLKWFVTTRNKTTKETPFPLKKEIVVDVYLPQGLYRLKNDSFLVDFDETFKEALDIIKEIFVNQLGFVEVFFSAKLLYRDGNTEVDLYPKIIDGIVQMDAFLNTIRLEFPCECDKCNALSSSIEPLYKNVLFKQIYFVRDYAYEINKELMVGDTIQMFLGNKDSNYKEISEVRSSLDNPIFGDSNGCIFSIFKRFIVSHIVIFQMQEHEIMPTFMIVFSDNTCKMMPFVATTKSTFYRKVNEIVESINFEEVLAVIYCGECYLYDLNQLPEITIMPYSDRIGLAKKEMLHFAMLLKQSGEWSVSFDESKIDDMEYIQEQLKTMQHDKDFSNDSLDWLNPIKEKLGLLDEKD